MDLRSLCDLSSNPAYATLAPVMHQRSLASWYRFNYGAICIASLLALQAATARGIVEPANAPTLKAEIKQKMEALQDPQNGAAAIACVYIDETIYEGPYVDEIDIMDIGPTVLDLFGVPVPAHCDGRSVMPAP